MQNQEKENLMGHSRVLKFRAWDKRNKQMMVNELEVLSLMSDANRNYEYMQFTGLLDKNGKEIYEGDIVKRTLHGFDEKEIKAEDSVSGRPYITRIENGNKKVQIYYVEYIAKIPEARFILRLIRQEPDIQPKFESNIFFSESCEIIGNIYEGESLLTNQTK